MIRRLKTERNMLLSMVIVCLVALIISGISEKRTYTENKELRAENWSLILENKSLVRRNEDYFVENDILLRRIWEYEQKELYKQAIIYDIPLSEDLQEYTYELCEENNVDYELVLAIMDQESDYREHVISETNDYGIMQINVINHTWLSETLNINDFLDAEQNIKAGIYILRDLSAKYEDTHKTLMAYNMGEYGAQKKWDQGILTSQYSRQVVERADELREVENAKKSNF